MNKYVFLLFFFLSLNSFAQSDFEKVLKSGELIVNGLSFIKGNKPKNDGKNVESFCVKNKLTDKIIFKLTGKDTEGNDIKKELVIQNDGKECVYLIPKGIWSYEIILSNKEIFKKGEFKIDDDIIITVKND